MQRAQPVVASPAEALRPQTFDTVYSGASWSPTAVPALGDAAPSATFAPAGYEPGYAYPLLVWLHSDRADERSLHRVMGHVSLRNFVAVAPRGVDACEEGFAWGSARRSIAQAEEAVFEAIEHAGARFHLHPNRVFLAGAGAGGAAAVRIAAGHPDRFAGVATVNGALPLGPRSRLMSRVNELRRLPFLLSASRENALYPEALVCRDLRLLHSAGCRVAVRQYPGTDDLTTAMLADLNRWAMELVCG